MPIPSLPESTYQVNDLNPSTVQAANVLAAKVRPVFHLVHYPRASTGGWEIGSVIEKVKVKGKWTEQPVAYWLPELTEVPVVPGANLCRTLKRGEPPENAYREQLTWFARSGRIAIPMDAIVGDIAGYVRNTPCRNPLNGRSGLYHFDAWSIPKVVREGKGVKYHRDQYAFNAWRLELVRHGWRRPNGTTGRLPDIDPDVIAMQLDRAKYHLARKEAEVNLPPRAYDNEVEVREAIVEAVSGAKVPKYEGDGAVPVTDYSAVLIQILSKRVADGEDPEDVIAEVPNLEPHIADVVRAAKPKQLARANKGTTK